MGRVRVSLRFSPVGACGQAPTRWKKSRGRTARAFSGKGEEGESAVAVFTSAVSEQPPTRFQRPSINRGAVRIYRGRFHTDAPGGESAEVMRVQEANKPGGIGSRTLTRRLPVQPGT